MHPDNKMRASLMVFDGTVMPSSQSLTTQANTEVRELNVENCLIGEKSRKHFIRMNIKFSGSC